MNFGQAIEALKAGKRVARAGWNGKGMWLRLVDDDHEYAEQRNSVNESEVARDFDDRKIQMLPWIGMKTADDKFVPWLASQTDILAEDWEIVS